MEAELDEAAGALELLADDAEAEEAVRDEEDSSVRLLLFSLSRSLLDSLRLELDVDEELLVS